ncbi:hypothetical protein AOLI_G00027830 [Acnodon oligacanthus]
MSFSILFDYKVVVEWPRLVWWQKLEDRHMHLISVMQLPWGQVPTVQHLGALLLAAVSWCATDSGLPPCQAEEA